MDTALAISTRGTEQSSVPTAPTTAPFVLDPGPRHESWCLKLVDPDQQRALSLRFTVLVSANGFRRMAEVCGTFFERLPTQEVSKVTLQQTFELRDLRARNRIGPCEFSPGRTRGTIQSKGKRLEWDLALTPRQQTAFSLIPSPLQRSGVLRQGVTASQPDLSVSGTMTLAGRRIEWRDSPGMQGEESGSRHPGIRGQCNHFRNERGEPVPFAFEGLCLRGRLLGAIPTPRFSSFSFLHRGELFQMNSLRDTVRVKSRIEPGLWTFQAEQGDAIFRGQARYESRDFASLSFEDTDGSIAYCSASELSEIDIQVFRRGKREAVLRSGRSACIELISRHRRAGFTAV